MYSLVKQRGHPDEIFHNPKTCMFNTFSFCSNLIPLALLVYFKYCKALMMSFLLFNKALLIWASFPRQPAKNLNVSLTACFDAFLELNRC